MFFLFLGTSKSTSGNHECLRQTETFEQNTVVDSQCEGQTFVDVKLSCKGRLMPTKLTIFFLVKVSDLIFFVLDGGQESDKENVYFEDSDDSVKDPNFKTNCNNKSSSSDSSSSRPTARKRVRQYSHFLAMEQKQQTQPENNTDTPWQSGCMTENHDPTPSTSKGILHRRMSTSSDSSSSSSESSSTSSSSSSSNSSSTASNEVLPCRQENVENEVPDLARSPIRKSTKKRKSNIDEWLTNKAKTLRNTGKLYTSRSKSRKNIPARHLKPPCGEKCKLECTKKITNATRTKIFECYWQLGDLSLQRNFIHKHITPIIPAFRFSGKAQPRNVNHSFYFDVDGQTIRVCKTFFRATLDINDRVIRTVIAKSENGFLKQDMRGKHNNHKKVAESIRQGIRSHINSIPRMESHYIRKDSSREYIDGGKSLSDLYRDYKSLCESNNVPYANETLYSRIFNGEYNIIFFKPKKDRCELCVRYENAQGNANENDIKVEYFKHIEEKNLSRIEKEADKSNVGPDNIVAIYDLQAVLQLPRGNTSIFYYKSKLNTLNFTISHIGNDKTDCFYWHEGEANRGADEIGSCIYKFIENTMINYDGPGLDLIFYSDNCCGQNKNRFIVSVYLFALLKFPKIKCITHKYLITGHTQNEADSVHSTIEKQIQKRLKSGPIYVPSQYVEAIKCAKKKGRPYAVTEMSCCDFYSLKRLSEDIGLTTKSFKISEIKVLKLMQDDPTKLLYKTSFMDDQFSETVLTRKKNLNQITLKLAYRSKPKLKENKIKDLQELLRNNHIPHFYESFYNSLK